MTPERWQQIERIYQDALDHEPSTRSAFLDQACAGDADLRREVVSLLEAHKPDDQFLEAPALEVTARALAAEAPRLARGQRLGSYELIAPLGAGGMGEVWRALDPDLNRQVAIKILLSQYSRDPQRLRRFEQEARAAGMLNHPNILAIYAVGKEEGSPYLVTELLEGATLRQRLAGGAIPEGKAIEYAGEITLGLADAHDKGIIHWDLKPENTFITLDGRLKILDFGLAMRVQPGPEPQDETQTASGMALDTPAYMAPEQARGKTTDHRSDIFALGAVLYEMLAGRPQPPGFRGSGLASCWHRWRAETSRSSPGPPHWSAYPRRPFRRFDASRSQVRRPAYPQRRYGKTSAEMRIAREAKGARSHPRRAGFQHSVALRSETRH